MNILKCEICEDLATWYNKIHPDDAIGLARCDKHLPLDCNCNDCSEYVEFDDEGKRTETCMNQSWEYCKGGWKPCEDMRNCVEPILL